MAMQHVQGTLIGSIDEGTSSARFLVFSSQTGRLVASHQIPISKHCAQEGWVEQDPVAIMDAVRQCLDKGATILNDKDIDVSRIAAIGISNQRETTILWDRTTGLPLHNAIVWLDMRTATTLESLLDKIPNRDKNYLKPICGLPLSPYFSALKIKWLMDNIPEVRQAIENKTCLFGTMDTWLMWNLTGGTKGGVHVTDVTNASRTMLMSLNTLDWDISLCKFFDIPREILPRIHSSSEIYGRIVGGAMDGIPIAGVINMRLCLDKNASTRAWPSALMEPDVFCCITLAPKVICGITEETTKSHILRAALEAICFQTRDILESMDKDCGLPLSKIQVDGGAIQNNLLMQLKADLCGIPVVRPHMAETSALGAALAAGVASGIGVCKLTDIESSASDLFSPRITKQERDNRYSKWKMAIERSFGWDINISAQQ
ncbi:glycerol kinase 1 isoform X3 [Rhodnius prolixus]|uniref:glycerol kinase 1 isoform X3 n=1 Tax=Rhodnius prolixus TaxID=13249 RepID=UPI003D18C639